MEMDPPVANADLEAQKKAEKKERKAKKARKDDAEGGESPAAVAQTDAVVKEAAKPVEKIETPVVSEPKKVEETPKAEEEKPKVEEVIVEKPKDVETDAPEDKRKRITDKVAFHSACATINVSVSDENVLSSFTKGGLGQLLAGARANIGVKSGRYYYEVKIVDLPNPSKYDAKDKCELQVGFSTSKGSMTGEDALMFDVQNGYFRAGAKKTPITKGQFAKLPDVVGILLNRDASTEKNNTISLFVNGERKTEPQTIPADSEALFPHVLFKNCSLSTNFRTVWKMPLFTVRPIGDASAPDIEKISFPPAVSSEVIFPIGFDTADHVQSFETAHPDYTVITQERMKQWAELSGHADGNLPCVKDNGKQIGAMMRQRKYLMKMGDLYLATERKELCSKFLGYKRIAHVSFTKTSMHLPNYEKVTLPTAEDGFDEIVYITSKEECEQALESWKADCKLRSRVDLKVGPLYEEKMAAFRKLFDEKKKDKETYPDLAAEDYMLIQLRAEVHYVLHAFKTDVNDESRPGFVLDHFAFYYKKYNKQGFFMETFGLKQMEDLVELIKDTIEINDKAMLVPKHAQDSDAIAFFEFAEAERKDRQDRLDAGDENAALNFSAAAGRLLTKGAIKIPQKMPTPAQGNAIAPMRTIEGALKRGAPAHWGRDRGGNMQKRSR